MRTQFRINPSNSVNVSIVDLSGRLILDKEVDAANREITLDV